ncbi:MAG: hypothetical protein GEV28_38365 [Actinophytocola sp.]|uniref:hypothetical protein n=1 Tax=Actinophytocola sp. TaxID=1872138 RepID=UPI0013210B95|nr:hypothetical protein [Actinophytocola sp.]MPZ85929.1 hypothetical protein [Actinophytocola sp.]
MVRVPGSYSVPVVDHFAVHRWERHEPAVAVLAIPPAAEPGVGQDVRRLAAAYQRHLTGRGVSVIPARWLHVTVCMLGWASDLPASGQNYADFLAVFANRVGQVLHAPTELQGAQVGRTGVLLGLREGVVMVSSGGAAAAAERTLGRRGETPRTPHLGLAYFTSEQADPYASVNLANQPDQLGKQTAYWTVDHLSVVDLVQDRAARQYRWTVRDEIPLLTAPRPVHDAG